MNTLACATLMKSSNAMFTQEVAALALQFTGVTQQSGSPRITACQPTTKLFFQTSWSSWLTTTLCLGGWRFEHEQHELLPI